jgi:hypothetical protein
VDRALDYNNIIDDTEDTILTHRSPQTANPDTSTEACAAAATNSDTSVRDPEGPLE